MSYRLSRLLAPLALLTAVSTVQAQALPTAVVHEQPGCGCCHLWVEHLKTSGFATKAAVAQDIWEKKQRLGVPQQLASCHTAEIGGYVFEGHVPADLVKQVLRDKPAIRGLAVPGMPAGSPGMEMPDGRKDRYQVMAFDRDGKTRVYATR